MRAIEVQVHTQPRLAEFHDNNASSKGRHGQIVQQPSLAQSCYQRSRRCSAEKLTGLSRDRLCMSVQAENIWSTRIDLHAGHQRSWILLVLVTCVFPWPLSEYTPYFQGLSTNALTFSLNVASLSRSFVSFSLSGCHHTIAAVVSSLSELGSRNWSSSSRRSDHNKCRNEPTEQYLRNAWTGQVRFWGHTMHLGVCKTKLAFCSDTNGNVSRRR